MLAAAEDEGGWLSPVLQRATSLKQLAAADLPSLLAQSLPYEMQVRVRVRARIVVSRARVRVRVRVRVGVTVEDTFSNMCVYLSLPPDIYICIWCRCGCARRLLLRWRCPRERRCG